MDISTIREKYPQYDDLSDKQLAEGFHSKFYSDMDFGEFAQKIGLSTKTESTGSKALGAVREGLQGMWLGSSDEIGAGVAAAGVRGMQMLGATPDTGESYREIYDNIHGDLQGQREQFREENPGTALAANIGGAVLTGGAGAAKVLSKLPSTASKLQRAGAVSAVGGVEGGIIGASSANQGERLKGGATGAAVGAVAAPVVAGAVNTVTGKLAQRSAEKAVAKAAPTREEVKAASSALYKEADDLGVSITQQGLSDLSDGLSGLAKASGFNKRIHPKVAAALESFEDLAGKNPTLKELDIQRRILGSAANSMEPDERRIAAMLIEELDDYVLNIKPQHIATGNGQRAGEILEQARGLWAQNRKAGLIEDALEKARNQASGFENGIRVQFRNLLNDKKKMRGFTDEEKDAIKQVVRGTKKENMLRLIGKLGFGEGASTNLVGASIGAGFGSLVGGTAGAVMTPIAGQLARNAAQKATRNNAKIVEDVILSGGTPRKLVGNYLNKTGDQADPAELAQILVSGSSTDIIKLASQLTNLKGTRRKIAGEALSIVATQQAQ